MLAKAEIGTVNHISHHFSAADSIHHIKRSNFLSGWVSQN